MLREVKEWENKYIKLVVTKTFKLFKWEFNINFSIINKQWHKEWKNLIDKMIRDVVTTANNDVNSKWHVEA